MFDLPGGSFPLALPSNILYALFSIISRSTCPANRSLLDLIISIALGEAV
jgi:hypothetical protein